MSDDKDDPEFEEAKRKLQEKLERNADRAAQEEIKRIQKEANKKKRGD